MADQMFRKMIANEGVPVIEAAAFTSPPPLAEARVAIVTTAGLRKAGDAAWGPGDQSFRVFDNDDRDVQLGHLSPNFDRAGFAADINVAYPADRLAELAAEGTIGSVGAHHISFMGAQDDTMTKIRMDSGKAAAKILKDDGVNVVILTPV